MKQLILILLLSISFASCQEKSTKENNESTSKILINVEKLKKASVGFQDKYDSLPKLEINQIGKDKYLTFNRHESVVTKSSIKEDKKYYYLGIDNETFQFRKEEQSNKQSRDGQFWYDYIGFYPSINMYAFSSNSVNESSGFSDFELINKKNGKIYQIVSPGDDRIENPILSVHNNYLAYYHNNAYENGCFIGILTIDTKGNFKEYRSFQSDNFKINEIKWNNENSILLKISSDNDKTFDYYKTNPLIE
ncbi:hypothetical protein [Empedobacter falsenii]